MKKIILASGSPRRKELLEQMGLSFSVEISREKEELITAPPGELVEHLASQKAVAVASEQEEDCLVIGADTVVVLDGEILGKPKNTEDACQMLTRLQGREHQVYTGVCLVNFENFHFGVKTFSNCTTVHVAAMTVDEILGYVDSGEPMDKAGAYGIQGSFAKYVEGIEGDYYNVVGLPLCHVYQELKEML